MAQHIPRVRLVTPKPDMHGATPAIFTRLTIDDVEWAITDYTIRGKADDIQQVTLTFLADVTIEHPSEEAT